MTYYNSSCPVETTLQLISSRWKVLILRDLLTGTKRFGELRKSIGMVFQQPTPFYGKGRPAYAKGVCGSTSARGIYSYGTGAQSAPRPGLHGGMGIEIPKRKPLILPPFRSLTEPPERHGNTAVSLFPARKVSGKFPSFYG